MAENTNYQSQFEIIGHSKVHCINYKSGCHWNGKEKFAEDHVKTCGYTAIPCMHCKEVILKDQYQDHLLFYCRNKMFKIISHTVEGTPIYRCGNYESGCEWIGRGVHKEDHAYRCNYRSIICSCCEDMILKGFYYDHMLLFCRHRMDGSCYEDWNQPSLDFCPRSHLGCKWRGTPAMLEEQHARQCNWQEKRCSACGKMCIKHHLCTHILNECPLMKMRHVEGTFGNGVYSFNKQPSKEKK